jgi:hypothetical protein
VYIEDNLTEQDIRRIDQAEITPRIVTAGHIQLLQACDTVCQEILIPFIRQDPGRPQRQIAVIGLFYRVLGFCQTAIKLEGAAVHHQALTSAERSVIELWLDMELLHRNVFPDGVDRIMTFVEYQKLKAARRTVRFFSDHPARDETPSLAARQQAFITSNATAVDAKVAALWPRPDGKPPKPDHWSAMNVEARAERLGLDEKYTVIDGYDIRNFAVHTGLTGVMGFDVPMFEALCSKALRNIADCMISALKIIGRELDIHPTVDVYDSIIADLEKAKLFAVADHALRARGEPQRYFWHKGPWPGTLWARLKRLVAKIWRWIRTL